MASDQTADVLAVVERSIRPGLVRPEDERLAAAIAEVLKAVVILDTRVQKIEAALVRRGSA